MFFACNESVSGALLLKRKVMLMMEKTHHQSPASLFDSLYCSEEHWEDYQDPEYEHEQDFDRANSPFLCEQDLSWENEELISLTTKEEVDPLHPSLETDPSLANARREAVGWMMRVHSHYDFSALTAVLAVNYLDRFLFRFHLQEKEKPWTTQLVAVACLSLAAKVEETHVPLLLDLQVEESKFVFEAKTIQRMELLVLSTLDWIMNPVTPVSFLDYFTRRLGLKLNDPPLCCEILSRCHNILLALISDSRSTRYLPSVMATAVMLHVVEDLDPCSGAEYQNQLLSVLGLEMNMMGACSKLVAEAASEVDQRKSSKRKFGSDPGSPSGVMDVCFSCDSSNDSWGVAESVSSSPEPAKKKSRAEGGDQQTPPAATTGSSDIISSSFLPNYYFLI